MTSIDNKSVLAMKKDYFSGSMEKHEYLQGMLRKHSALKEYSELIKDSTLSEIRISDGMVVAVGRRFGVKHLVVFEDVSNIPLAILDMGDYEREEIEFILKLVRPDDYVFDIGGNTGWVSMNIAKKNPGTVVHAFEPIPNTSAIFEKNMELNALPNIHLHKVALSDKEGQAEFFFNRQESGATSMRNIRDTEKAVRISVKTERLDDFFVREGIRKLDFIKCDVEGAELFVLKGGLETIKQHKPILFVEMLRKWASKFNYHPNDIISLLAGHGFSCYAIEGETLSRLESMDDSMMATNFFFVHEERKPEILKYLKGK